MAIKVWVRLEDPLKQPLSYKLQADEYVANLVESVLEKEKEASRVSASDVRVYAKEEGAEDKVEVAFTEKVSDLFARNIGTTSNYLILVLPPKEKGMSVKVIVNFKQHGEGGGGKGA